MKSLFITGFSLSLIIFTFYFPLNADANDDCIDLTDYYSNRADYVAYNFGSVNLVTNLYLGHFANYTDASNAVYATGHSTCGTNVSREQYINGVGHCQISCRAGTEYHLWYASYRELPACDQLPVDSDGDGIPDQEDLDYIDTKKIDFGIPGDNCQVNRNQNLIGR